MPKWKAVLLVIGYLLLFTLFIAGFIIAIILTFVIGPVAGIIALPIFIIFYIFPPLKVPICYTLLSAIIWLPITMIAGIFVTPIAFLCYGLCPFSQVTAAAICNAM
jgi:hypothetical protein